MTIDPIELHRRAIDEFGRRVEAIAENQWGEPTPCADWDVRALVHHLVYENAWTPPMFEGKTIAEVGDQFERELLGTDPKGAWQSSAKQAHDAVSRPGAMGGTVHLSFGDFPGDQYSMQLTTDLTVHAWDQTSGSNGTIASIDGTGGETAFSTAADTASITINQTVAAPIVDLNDGSLEQSANRLRYRL